MTTTDSFKCPATVDGKHRIRTAHAHSGLVQGDELVYADVDAECAACGAAGHACVEATNFEWEGPEILKPGQWACWNSDLAGAPAAQGGRVFYVQILDMQLADETHDAGYRLRAFCNEDLLRGFRREDASSVENFYSFREWRDKFDRELVLLSERQAALARAASWPATFDAVERVLGPAVADLLRGDPLDPAYIDDGEAPGVPF